MRILICQLLELHRRFRAGILAAWYPVKHRTPVRDFHDALREAGVRDAIAAELFSAPVPSEDGLGIGLYHAARQAEGYGFSLALASNVQGAVCFELARADSSRLRGA